MLFFAFVKKLNYHITLMVTDNSTNGYSTLECKDYVKYLGVLIDNHLSWKYHIDYIASKLSKSHWGYSSFKTFRSISYLT